jgi:hypothetical protein
MTSNQVISTMVDIITYIHMVRIILVRDQDEEPGSLLVTYQFYEPNPGCEGYQYYGYTLSQTSTFYWFVSMLFSYCSSTM